MIDIVEAIRMVLLADATILELTSGRVFDTELPVNEDPHMPRKCVLVRAAGGSNGLGRGTLQINDTRFNILSYGETRHLAATVDTAVYDVLKPLSPSVWASTYLHWCKSASGPIPQRDPDLQWPYVVRSWEVLASDITVA